MDEKKRICLNCGKDIPPSRRGKPRLYCPEVPGEASCKNEFNRRRAVEGAKIISFAKAYAAARGLRAGHPGKAIGRQSWAEMTAACDAYNRADKEANRPAPHLAAEALLADGRFFDRER